MVRAMLPRMRTLLRAVILFFLLTISPLYARVVRVEIASRQDVLNGKSFGDIGPYERITGRVYFALAVANAHNRRIVDLKFARTCMRAVAESHKTDTSEEEWCARPDSNGRPSA